MEQKTNTQKVLNMIKNPSSEELDTYKRVGLISGGVVTTLLGLRKFRSNGWMFTMLGGAITYLGISGKNPLRKFNRQTSEPLTVKLSMVIDREKEVVYKFWRKLENLALFMDHIKEIKEVSNIRSKWKANLNGVDVEWEAEITSDVKGEKIAWRSLIVSDIQSNGQVTFSTTPDMKGTEVTLELNYASEAGEMAKAFAALYHPVFEKQVKKDLNECKKMMEADKIPQLHPEGQI